MIQKKLVSFGIIGFVFLVVAVNIAKQSSSSGQVPFAPTIHESCKTIADSLSHGSSLTTEQKNNLWDHVKWGTFTWSMKVVDVVRSEENYAYDITFLCENSNSYLSDVKLTFHTLPDETEKNMLNWVKGQAYTVSGAITDWDQMTGVLKGTALNK